MFCFNQPTYTVNTINKTDANYPHSLLMLKEDAPSALYCIGNISLLNQPKAAVVGSNNMNEMLAIRTDKMPRDLKSNYSIINSAEEGVEYYSLSVAKRNHHKTIMLLEGTNNVDNCSYDDIKPMIDEVIKDGGLLISLYDDNEEYIEHYYNHNHVLVMLADAIRCPQYSKKSCDIVSYARKMKKEVFDY